MTTTPPSAETNSPAESDPFFELLTDALRAGPGSAPWGEAVAKLREGGVVGGDEYGLLLRAREDVELGRDFRKVSAGPEFTRKVLDAVEREGRKRSGIPTATIVAILSGAVILGVIVTVIVMMSRGRDSAGVSQQAAVERLEAVSLPISVASMAPPAPPNGMKYSVETPATSPTTSGGRAVVQIVTTRPIEASLPAAIEAELVLPNDASAQAVSVFVADAAANAAREIVWQYSNGRAVVDVGGRPGEPTSLGAPGETLRVSIRFDRQVAIVEAGGRRLFAGPHGLTDGPRTAGIRLLQPATASESEPLGVKSISVAQAAPTQAGGR